jgi:phosphonoacetate hydrolase
MPNWQKIVNRPGFNSDGEVVEHEGEFTTAPPGHHSLVAAAMPTFTNPNNIAIMCGAPPNVTGICGNYYYDAENDKEVMMTSPSLLRADSIFAALSGAGVPVTVVTTKNKLLALLSTGLDADTSIAISVEDGMWEATQQRVDPLLAERSAAAAAGDASSSSSSSTSSLLALMDGAPPPPIYSGEASLYCIEMGLKLLRAHLATASSSSSPAPLFYLTTTDYLQHKFAPGTPEANSFMAQVDVLLGQFLEAGAVVGITADHGMNDKHRLDGTPKVCFAETELDDAGIGELCTEY